jgi:hypothetical protein
MRSRPASATDKRVGRSVLAAPPAAGAASGSAEDAPALSIAHVPGVTASAKLVELPRGLYALSIGETEGARRALAGAAVPATHITRLPQDGVAGVEVFAASAGATGWLGPEGGTVVIKVPSERGHVLITTYRCDDQEPVPLQIQITRIDRAAQSAPASDAAPAGAPGRKPAAAEIGLEIVLHIERAGDRRFAGGEWIGNRGQRRRIEAFGICPAEALAPSDIEYKAYGPNGRETPWVSDAKLCGTRGRGMPLTGFAIRLAPRLSGRYDIVYEGAFFDSGIAGPRRNGEPCLPAREDDPLEAVRIRLIAREDA